MSSATRVTGVDVLGPWQDGDEEVLGEQSPTLPAQLQRAAAHERSA